MTGPQGIDSETDGKTSFGFYISLPTSSACDPSVSIDCVAAPFAPWGWGQDEWSIGQDASLETGPPLLRTCTRSSMPITTFNCASSRTVFLNICVDMNRDGDWNDSFDCSPGCAYEWAVKNAPITLPSGCFQQSSPSFLVGPNGGNYWCRITISDEAALDDFPWNGCASLPGGVFHGGETEDDTWLIDQVVVGVKSRSWGQLKLLYR